MGMVVAHTTYMATVVFKHVHRFGLFDGALD